MAREEEVLVDEITVRVARAIASLVRLRLLSCLACDRELNPNRLAERLRIPASVVSAHLRTLLAAGLVRRRRSGAWSHYKADSPYGENTISGRLIAWLVSTLRTPEHQPEDSGPGKLRDDPCPGGSDTDSAVLKAIFDAATAFTDLRRLQILRHLARHGAATTRELVAELSMSDQAASRHIAKLRRRGYVRTRQPSPRHFTYELSAASKTPVHAEMFDIVRSVWETR
jgi:DNA-binding transcriptional ArsR family regulator